MPADKIEELNTSETGGNLDAPYQSWEDSLVSTKKTRLTKPRTVILCGFAGNTRHLAPYDRRNAEVWGLNEAYNHDFMKNSKGEFRADRWLQMHKYEDWTRRNNPNDKRHAEWMRAEHNFPIYTQEVWDDVPNSVKFPLEAVDNEFFRNLKVVTEEGKEVPWLEAHEHGYYTSSFAWMIALALYEGFERIEVWGFNMGSQSEYLYQAGSGSFWMGYCLGKEVELVFPERTPLLLGNMYGYEFSQIMQIGDMENRIAILKHAWQPLFRKAAFIEGRRMQLQSLRGEYRNEELEGELFFDGVEITTDVNFHSGAIAELEAMARYIRLRHPDDPLWTSREGWIDRLALEIRITKLRILIAKLKELLATVTGARLEVKNMIEEYETPELKKREMMLRQQELNWVNRLNRYLGAWTEQKLAVLNMDQRTQNTMDDFDLGSRVTLAPDTVTDVLDLTEDDDEVGEDDNGCQENTPDEA